MPKLRISGALQYLLSFLGRNERNKCRGVPKWLYIVGNLKKKKWIVQKDQVKKKFWKKNGLEQKQKEKKWNEERKEVEMEFELYCVKLVELVLFEKKNCAPLVFRNNLCLIYISFLHI